MTQSTRWGHSTMPGRRRPIAACVSLGAWATFTAFLAYYATVELPQLRLDVFKPTVMLHVICAVVLAVYALSLALRRRLPPPTPLDLPLLALVLAYAIAILTAVDVRLAWETALPALFAIALFFIASDDGPLTRERLRLTLLSVGLVAALRALLGVAQDYREWLASVQIIQGGIPRHLLLPPTVPRVHNAGDNPNVIATLFAVLLPLTLTSALHERRFLFRLAMLAIAALLGAALFFTLSRAAWLGAVLGLVTTVALLMAPFLRSNTVEADSPLTQGEARRTSRRSRSLTLRVALIGGLVGAMVLIAIGLWRGSRPAWLFRPSFGPRLDAMQAGLKMWWDHPLTGVGPAGYALLYPEYSGRHPLLTVHAHNGYVQTGVELGLLGVFAVGAGGLVLLQRLMSGLRRGDRQQCFVIAAVIGGGIAFLTQSLLDATYEFKSVPALLAVLLALGLKVAAPDPSSAGTDAVQASDTSLRPVVRARRPVLQRVRGLTASLVVLPLLALLPIAWLYADRAHASYSSGLSWANAGRWAEAAERFEAATHQDPRFALYYFQAGLAHALASDGGRAPDHLQKAIAHYQRGLALEPRSVLGWANYARVLAWAGDREGAHHALVQARRFGAQDVAVQLSAGTLLEELGYEDEAADAYVRTLVLDSERITAPFWEATAFRREHRRWLIEAVNRQLPLLATANPAFDLSRAEPPMPAMRPRLDEHLRLAQHFLLTGAMDEAFQIIQGVLATQPDKAEAHGLLGDWYARQGRLDAARESWFKAGYLGDSESLRKLGETYNDTSVPLAVTGRQRRVLASSSQVVVLDGVQFYWIGIQYYRSVYLRASPHTILIPGAWEEAQPRAILEAARALDAWKKR